jgi:hypothetical protein
MEKRANQHNVFWQALIVAVLVFAFGFMVGIFIENSRSIDMNDRFAISSLSLKDLELQSQIIGSNFDCDFLVSKNTEFGNTVYEDAKTLDEYEKVSKLTSSITTQHRQYDLLRTEFWLNSINLKKKCSGVHTAVYLYDYQPEGLAEKQKQAVFSKFLIELDSKYPDCFLLIPISKNMGLLSLSSLTESYNISNDSAVIFADEMIQVTSIEDLSLIENYFSQKCIQKTE